jgi:hypothetical protein
MDMAKLRDWLFGLGPEESLRIFHEYALDERDGAKAEWRDVEHVKYWSIVATAVLNALNEIRIKDGRMPVRADGDGRIIERTL